MRKYNLRDETEKLLTLNIINTISLIHEYKGKQALYIESKKDALTSLLNIAKIQSSEYSNKIEGIQTTDIRIKEIINNKVAPRSRNEEEIAGYRDVLERIHDNYENIPLTPSVIKQLHKELYKYSALNFIGKFKASDNYIEEIDKEGNTHIRFKPVSAFETPMAIDFLCESYNKEINKGEVDPLLLIPIFIIDFLSIHPFADGNGRISRLLTLLLLYKSGYIVGKYISIEKLVENSKEGYYDSLKKSSVLWHENKNQYNSFVEYYLGIILRAYQDFSDRTDYIINKKLTAKERVQMIIDKNISKTTKKQIVEMCPDLNEGSIERALRELLKENKILKISGGRFASYVINGK